MRMWMIPPKKLCKKHLIGEHLELHMLAGCIRKGKSLKGFINKQIVAPQMILARHEELVEEMLARGWKHRTPIDQPINSPIGFVSIQKSYNDLINRCKECKKRINKND